MKAKPALLACASFLLAWFQLSPWSFGQYSPQLYIPSAHPAFEATTCIDSQNRVCIEWPTQRGYVYRIEDSETLDSGWSFTHFPAFYYGAGQRIRVPVYVIPAQPGDPPPIVDPHPNYLFLICSFSNHSGALISWHGPDAENHRAFVDLAFSGPLPNGREFPIFYVYTDAAATVDLLNFAYMPWDPSYAALSPATLPAPAADYLAELTSRYADMVASLPETPETSLSTPSPQTASGPHRFFRISAQLQDSDSDGLPDNAELSSIYNSDPFAADTDGDGLSDLMEAMTGTSLRSRDSDGDGFDDSQDPNPRLFNADANHDGLPDAMSSDLMSAPPDYQPPNLVPLDLGEEFNVNELAAAWCDDLGLVGAVKSTEVEMGPHPQVFWKLGKTLATPENCEVVQINPFGPVLFRRWDPENHRWLGHAVAFSQEIDREFKTPIPLGTISSEELKLFAEVVVNDRIQWDSNFAANRERLAAYPLEVDDDLPPSAEADLIGDLGVVTGRVSAQWRIGPRFSSDTMTGTITIPCLWMSASYAQPISLAPVFYNLSAPPGEKFPTVNFHAISLQHAVFTASYDAPTRAAESGYLKLTDSGAGGKTLFPATFQPRHSMDAINYESVILGTHNGSATNPELCWKAAGQTPEFEQISIPGIGLADVTAINDERLLLGRVGLISEHGLAAKVEIPAPSGGVTQYQWQAWPLNARIVPDCPVSGPIPTTVPPPKWTLPPNAKIWQFTNTCLLATATNTDNDSRLVLFVLTEGFLDGNNNPIHLAEEALSISNWTNEKPGVAINGFPLQSHWDEPAPDVENFRVGLALLGANPGIAYRTTLELQSTHDANRATGGSVTKNVSLLWGNPRPMRNTIRTDFFRLNFDPDDRVPSPGYSFLAALGDKIRVSYPLYENAPERHHGSLLISVGRPESENDNGPNPHRHDIRRLKIRIITFSDPDLSPPDFPFDVGEQVIAAQQIYSQAGILIEEVERLENRPFFPLDLSIPVAYYDGYDNPNMEHGFEPTGDSAGLKWYLDSDPKTVDVFYIRCRQFYFSDYASAFYPGLPHSAENGVNYIVIDTSKASLSNTLAHELMHVLLASGHLDADHPRKSLFYSGGIGLREPVDKQIGPFKMSGSSTIWGEQNTATMRQWIPQ